MTMIFLVVLPLLTVALSWVPGRRSLYVFLACLWSAAVYGGCNQPLFIGPGWIFQGDANIFIRVAVLFIFLALFSCDDGKISANRSMTLSACVLLAASGFALQTQPLFFLAGASTVLAMESQQTGDYRSRKLDAIFWVFMVVLCVALWRKAALTSSPALDAPWPTENGNGPWAVFWGALPVLWYLTVFGYTADTRLEWQRLALWSSGEALFISLFQKAVLFPSALAIHHRIEDRLSFLLSMGILASVVWLSLRVSRMEEGVRLWVLFRAALFAGSLLLPAGGKVIGYLAATWWLPLFLFLVGRFYRDPGKGLVCKGNPIAIPRVIGITGMFLLMGFPPFLGGSTSVDAFRALAWPTWLNASLWIFPLLCMGWASARIPMKGGHGRYFQVAIVFSLAVESLHVHVLLGVTTLLAGIVIIVVRRHVELSRPAKGMSTL